MTGYSTSNTQRPVLSGDTENGMCSQTASVRMPKVAYAVFGFSNLLFNFKTSSICKFICGSVRIVTAGQACTIGDVWSSRKMVSVCELAFADHPNNKMLAAHRKQRLKKLARLMELVAISGNNFVAIKIFFISNLLEIQSGQKVRFRSILFYKIFCQGSF